MATDLQPAAAAGAAAEAAAAGVAQHPSDAADAMPLSEEDHNLLFLLANIANDDAEEAVPGRRAARRRSDDASSSGGSSDTQSKMPGGSAGRQQRLTQQRLRMRRQAAAALQGEEEDEDYSDNGADEDYSDAEGPRGGPRARVAAAAAATAAAAPGDGVGGESGVRVSKRPKPSKALAPMGQRRYVSSQITIPILEAEGCFNMTQVDAARHLGFGSSTVLKKVMRRLGIKQWPYRKRTSAKKITHSLEEYMRKYGDPAKVDAVLERVRMELAVYEASPTGSIPLRPELAALRQRLYKLDNKVKHEFKRDAEAPLRQCVHSLVEKTWQELQPSWMEDLAQQPAAPLPPSSAENTPLGLPGLALPLAGAEGGDGAGGGVSDATLMLAMLLAQGISIPAGLGVPAMPLPAGQQGGTDAAVPVIQAEAAAAVEEEEASRAAAAPAADAQAAPPLDPGEAEALARARVAALAPDGPVAASADAEEASGA